MEFLSLISSTTRDGVNTHLAALTAGVLSHTLYFIRGYHDTSAFGIFLFHVFAFFATCLTCIFISQEGLLSGMMSATLIFSVYLGSLFSSIAIYRIFFHPLRRFPGPLAAKLTKFYGPYLAWKGQLHLEQNKLFEIYGDVVRIGEFSLLKNSGWVGVGLMLRYSAK